MSMATIGTIGAGNIGTAIARLAAGTGHRVTLSNSRGPATLAEQAQSLGSHVSAGTIQEAAGADIVVVTVPLNRMYDLPVDLLCDKVVIDTMNYYPARDGAISCGSRYNCPPSGSRPRRAPGEPNTALALAMRRSHDSASMKPAA